MREAKRPAWLQLLLIDEHRHNHRVSHRLTLWQGQERVKGTGSNQFGKKKQKVDDEEQDSQG